MFDRESESESECVRERERERTEVRLSKQFLRTTRHLS
jgi:hypothetical protein